MTAAQTGDANDWTPCATNYGPLPPPPNYRNSPYSVGGADRGFVPNPGW